MTASVLPDLTNENRRTLQHVVTGGCTQTSGGLNVIDVRGSARRINLRALIAAGLVQLNGASQWVTTPAGDDAAAAWQGRATAATRFLHEAVNRRGI